MSWFASFPFRWSCHNPREIHGQRILNAIVTSATQQLKKIDPKLYFWIHLLSSLQKYSQLEAVKANMLPSKHFNSIFEAYIQLGFFTQFISVKLFPSSNNPKTHFWLLFATLHKNPGGHFYFSVQIQLVMSLLRPSMSKSGKFKAILLHQFSSKSFCFEPWKKINLEKQD